MNISCHHFKCGDNVFFVLSLKSFSFSTIFTCHSSRHLLHVAVMVAPVSSVVVVGVSHGGIVIPLEYIYKINKTYFSIKIFC